MPVFTPQQSLEYIINSQPGLRSQIEAAEPAPYSHRPVPQYLIGAGQPPPGQSAPAVQAPAPATGNPSGQPQLTTLDLIPGIKNHLSAAAQQMYPQNPLSPEEMDRYNHLRARAARLAPLPPAQYGEAGSAGIPGNPYTIDNRSMHQGISNLARGVANRIRGNRMEEFQGELSTLHGRQTQNIQNQESADQFLQKMFPQVFTQASINQRETNQQQASDARHNEDRQSRERIAAANNQNRIEVQRLRNKYRADPNNPQNRQMFVSGINNYVKNTHPELELIPNQIRNIMQIANGYPDEEQTKIINQLEEQFIRQSRSAAKMYRDMGVVPPVAGGREPSEKEFSTLAIMNLKGVPQDIITNYAKDLQINYIPPEGISPDTASITLDNNNEEPTDFGDLWQE